jgi:hypothetical protein
MRAIIDDGQLLSPLTPSATKKEAEELLKLLKEEVNQVENKGDSA